MNHRYDADARDTVESWRAAGDRLVFTNGVFDLLHPGHVEYLEEARALGDRLIVGINADASVRRLKGERRPVIGELDRRALIAALESVDLAVVFDEDTPERLIGDVRPHVLVKGGDWAIEAIVGRERVESEGGEVRTVRVREGLSTSRLIERLLARFRLDSGSGDA